MKFLNANPQSQFFLTNYKKLQDNLANSVPNNMIDNYESLREVQTNFPVFNPNALLDSNDFNVQQKYINLICQRMSGIMPADFLNALNGLQQSRTLNPYLEFCFKPFFLNERYATGTTESFRVFLEANVAPSAENNIFLHAANTTQAFTISDSYSRDIARHKRDLENMHIADLDEISA